METNLDRRGFLGRAAGVGGAVLAAGAVTPALAGLGGAADAAQAMQPSVARIGLQLYTVGDQLRNVDQMLENVARVGYKVVEFAGYGDRTPAQIRATMDRLGMTAPSTHVGLAQIRSDFDGLVGTAQTLGHKYITVPSLGGQDMPPPTEDGWKRLAATFNELGARLKARGIGLAFHNHREEFVPLPGGKVGMDVFIAETDPSLVSFEFDLGWMIVASQSPTEWFRKYPGRIKMWHVKDMLALQGMQEQQNARFRGTPPPAAPPAQGAAPAGQGAQGGQGAAPRPAPAVTSGPVPVGAGEINFKPIFDDWRRSGLEYFFVEQDGAANWPAGSIGAITTSYRNLVQLLT
jgi:sugar phosphate isomerase/epimerase